MLLKSILVRRSYYKLQQLFVECVFLVCIKTYINYCLALPNNIFDGFTDFKLSTQLVSTVVVAAITVFEVRFEFLAASRIRSYLYAILRLTNNELLLLLSIIIMYSIFSSVQAERPGNSVTVQ